MTLPVRPGVTTAVSLATVIVPAGLGIQQRDRPHGASTLAHGSIRATVPRGAVRQDSKSPGAAAPVPGARRGHRHHSTAATRTALFAHIAAAGGVVIRDFAFRPASTTVQAGATLTWHNDGPATHTATAVDHSFDTGPLAKGQSASHTFTSPGTFSYVCTIHPFMKATVVVLGAASTGHTRSAVPASASPGVVAPGVGAGSSSGAAPASTTNTSTTSRRTVTRPQLPLTGLDAIQAAVLGLTLVIGGAGLRRASKPVI